MKLERNYQIAIFEKLNHIYSRKMIGLFSKKRLQILFLLLEFDIWWLQLRLRSDSHYL